MSGEEQFYGTRFDQDAEGWPIPFPIRDPDDVNKQRLALGLNSIEERISEMRERETARREAVSPMRKTAPREPLINYIFSWRRRESTPGESTPGESTLQSQYSVSGAWKSVSYFAYTLGGPSA